MARSDWLKPLSKRDEGLRLHHGLVARHDGWYKWHRGKKRYIAKPMPLADVVKVLPARLDEIDGKAADRNSPLALSGTTINDLAEMYLAHLWQRHTTGQPRKLARHTYDDYLSVLEKFVEVVGPDEPAVAAEPTWFSRYMRTIAKAAASTRNRHIIYISAFFNWAGPGRHSLNFYKSPVQFGPDFRKPAEAMQRSERAEYSTLYTAEQFAAAMHAVAPCPLLYAMGLLALNCAFIPEDLTTIPMQAVDLGTGFVTFPRGKTGIERKAVLMPETADALARYLTLRPDVGDEMPLFVREDGSSYNQRGDVGPDKATHHNNTLSQYWSRITGRQLKGLRTTFLTHADACADQRAVDVVAGHAASTIRAKHYVKHFDPERIRTVTEHVWQLVAFRGCLPAVASIGPAALARRVASRLVASARRRQPKQGSGSAAG